jgi:pimeloyl-ACP methyl ester carboxylesterase
MPFALRDGARIHWTSLGSGEPVVLVMGLGCSSAMWFRVAPQLARTHRVILIDNRGTGQTRVPFFVVHRVSAMAADIAAVLDAAGESSAHLVGFSMGGMISQQFAVDHPGRVRSLALLGTHCGVPWARQAQPHVLRLLFEKSRMGPEESLRAMRPHTYAAGMPDQLFEEDAVVRLANMPGPRDYQAQLHALIYWSVYMHLPKLRMPTLILHGLQDELIPPANARILASRIRETRLLELPQASHWLMTDSNAACIDALGEHLHRNR